MTSGGPSFDRARIDPYEELTLHCASVDAFALPAYPNRRVGYVLASGGGPRVPGVTTKSSGISHTRPVRRAPLIRRCRHSCCTRNGVTPNRAAASVVSIIFPIVLSILWTYSFAREAKCGATTSIRISVLDAPAPIQDNPSAAASRHRQGVETS
jgi:hypothetical protein